MSKQEIKNLQQRVDIVLAIKAPDEDISGSHYDDIDVLSHLSEMEQEDILNLKYDCEEFVSNSDGSLNRKKVNYFNKAIVGAHLYIDQSQYGNIGDCDGYIIIENSQSENDEDFSEEPKKIGIETKKVY